MDGPLSSYRAYLRPSAPPTSSVSTSLDHAGGASAGGSRKNSIAFGTLPLRIRVNEGSFWAAAKPECPLFSAVIGGKPDVVLTSPKDGPDRTLDPSQNPAGIG